MVQGADEPLHPACTCLAAHLLWEMQQPLTQTAHVPAREPVPENQREAARLGLELRRETLLSRAALLYHRICDSLIPWLKIKESHRIPYRPGPRRRPMRRASQGPLSGARFHRPTPDRSRTRLAHARRLRLARPRCGVRKCADSGCSTPTKEGRHRMTDPRRTWEKALLANRRQRRAIQQRGHSAPSRLPAGVCREHKEHGQRLPHPATAAPQGGAPTMAVAPHYHPSECHLGRDYRRSSTPSACGPRPCSVLRHALRRSRPGAESPAGQLRALQRRVRQWRMVMARLLISATRTMRSLGRFQ